MLYSGATSVLLSLSIALPVLALPSPEFFKRDDCHADNCLRNLRDSRYSAKASAFCSTYIPAATTVTVQSTITSPPPKVTSTVTGAGPTTTLTVTIDNTVIEFRRDENEFEDPIEDDLERRELYLDDTLDEIEDIIIQERILQSNVTTPTSTTATTTTSTSSTTTSTIATSTPPITTSPATTSGLPSYASACTASAGATVDPSRVSSACACLITSRASTTTVTTTVTSGPAATTTVTVPGPTTTVTATTYSSCDGTHYSNYQQLNRTAPYSVSTNHTLPDHTPRTKDNCCNACYGSPNCFAFLYMADDASCRIFTTDHTGNQNATLTPGGDMCPAGEYYDRGIGMAPAESGYEYGPCNGANTFQS